MRNRSRRIRTLPFLLTLTSRRRRAAINRPCVSWLSILFATCLGLASSNGVLMSKLAKYIVGRITLPCFNMGVYSSCHSQCLCSKVIIITCNCWQLIPLTPPTCNFFQLSGSFSFSRRRIRQDAYHFDISDVSAVAL